MKPVMFNNQYVEIEEIDSNSGHSDDAYIAKAYYIESGIELNEDELDQLAHQYPEVVYDMWFNNKLGEADWLIDYWND